MDNDWVNRRKQTRFRVKECLVRCSRQGLLSFLQKPDTEAGEVLNLSTGGLEFISSHGYRKGQQLKLTVDVPAYDEALTMSGVVRWVLEVPERGLVRTGIEFTRIADRMVERISRLEHDGLLRKIERQRDILL